MNVDDLLQAYARRVAFVMRTNGTTSTSKLNEYGTRHFSPVQFLGTFPATETPPKTKHRCFYIQNVDPASEPGTHWLGIARDPDHRDLLFDSFARPPTATWLPHLRGMALTEQDVDQEAHSTRCGQLCLAFGHVFINHGREFAQLC